jgi:TnpA family transposase
VPEGATVKRNGEVTWKVRGKKRTGKLSGTNRVSMQVYTWTAKFTDETGKVRCVPTNTANREVAERMQRLMRHSTPLLTAKLYIDVEGGDMMQALEQLSVFSVLDKIVSASPKESPNDSI